MERLPGQLWRRPHFNVGTNEALWRGKINRSHESVVEGAVENFLHGEQRDGAVLALEERDGFLLSVGGESKGGRVGVLRLRRTGRCALRSTALRMRI